MMIFHFKEWAQIKKLSKWTGYRMQMGTILSKREAVIYYSHFGKTIIEIERSAHGIEIDEILMRCCHVKPLYNQPDLLVCYRRGQFLSRCSDLTGFQILFGPAAADTSQHNAMDKQLRAVAMRVTFGGAPARYPIPNTNVPQNFMKLSMMPYVCLTKQT